MPWPEKGPVATPQGRMSQFSSCDGIMTIIHFETGAFLLSPPAYGGAQCTNQAPPTLEFLHSRLERHLRGFLACRCS